jgi:hypothetical protein
LEWLTQDLQDIEHGPSDEALVELVEDARRITKLYLERPKKLRPSMLADELNKNLQRVSGKQGRPGITAC